MNGSLLAIIQFLLDSFHHSVPWTPNRQSQYWDVLIDTRILERLDHTGICFAGSSGIVPRCRYNKFPLIDVRNVMPIAQSDWYLCPTESLQHETSDVPIASYQRCFIHGSTPSGPVMAPYMSFPMSPEVSYLLSTFQPLTTPQFVPSSGLLFVSSFSWSSSPASFKSSVSPCEYALSIYFLSGGNSCLLVFLAIQALSAHSIAIPAR